jgi:hypothetical protein
MEQSGGAASSLCKVIILSLNAHLVGSPCIGNLNCGRGQRSLASKQLCLPPVAGRHMQQADHFEIENGINHDPVHLTVVSASTLLSEVVDHRLLGPYVVGK